MSAAEVVPQSLPLSLAPGAQAHVVRAGVVHVFSVRDNGVRFLVAEAGPDEVVPALDLSLYLTAAPGAAVEPLEGTPTAEQLRGFASSLVPAVAEAAGPVAAPLPAEDPVAFARAVADLVDAAWTNQIELRRTLGRESLAQSRHLLQRSYEGLEQAARTLGPRVTRSAHPLVGALQVIGEHLCFTVVEPNPDELATAPDVFGLVLHRSGVRSRAVALRPGWQGSDSAYLGFLGRDEGPPLPVALLPGRRGARVVMPHQLAPRPLTDDDAARLLPRAFEFYAPLPRHRAVDVKDVFRLGMRGTAGSWWLVVGISLTIALLSLFTPLLTSTVVGTVIPQQEYGVLAQVALGLGGAALVAFVFTVVQGYAIARITQRATRNVQAAFWDRVLSLPASFFRDYTSGDLTTRVLAVDSLQQLINAQVVSSVLAAVFGMVNVVLMFHYSVGLALIASTFLLLTAAVILLVARAISRHAGAALEATRASSSWLVQVLAGVQKVRLAHAEARMEARYLGFVGDLVAAQARQTVAVGRLTAWFGFATAGATAAFFWLLHHQWDGSPPIDTANYLAFASAFGLALAGVQGLSSLVSPLANAGPTFALLRPMMEARPEDPGGRQNPGRLKGGIELRDVTFRYTPQGPLVLRGLNLVVAPGEMVALTGSSGAGKSTITRLLLGFDLPEEGQVLVDGRDLNDLDLGLVRGQMGVVVQNGTITRGTMISNILGNTAADEATAWEAAEKASIADDIKAMPMGMQSIVDPGNISGGQAQRILLARALVGSPALLILDEATSALDNVSQKTVTEAIAGLGVTRIVIAHRLSTIRAADRIIVMDMGQVVETGTYDELAAGNGVFASLVQRQLR